MLQEMLAAQKRKENKLFSNQWSTAERVISIRFVLRNVRTRFIMRRSTDNRQGKPITKGSPKLFRSCMVIVCLGPGHTELEWGDSFLTQTMTVSVAMLMNFPIKRVRIERVRIARPADSIRKILNRGDSFPRVGFFFSSAVPVRFFELKVFLFCMLPCVKYTHASDTAQGCCQEYAGASHGGGGRRLSWVRYFSVSSMSMLQLLRFVLCQDEFSKALTLLRRGTRFGAAPRSDGASETQFLSFFRDVEQLFPDWEDE